MAAKELCTGQQGCVRGYHLLRGVRKVLLEKEVDAEIGRERAGEVGQAKGGTCMWCARGTGKGPVWLSHRGVGCGGCRAAVQGEATQVLLGRVWSFAF